MLCIVSLKIETVLVIESGDCSYNNLLIINHHHHGYVAIFSNYYCF